eukprot:jgi/Botrbrau1/15125/Bobra.0283s0004.1
MRINALEDEQSMAWTEDQLFAIDLVYCIQLVQYLDDIQVRILIIFL